MTDISATYQKLLDDMVVALQNLNEEQLANLAAALSTAESRILAAMANNYPANVKKAVDISGDAI